MGFGDFFSGVCDFVSNAFSAFCDGVSLICDTLVGIGRAIGEGIKDICDKIGTEGILLIGSIALALIIPGFGIPELLSMIQIVAQVAKMLNIGGEDSPEELGMKSEITDKKPDDFETTEAYIKYLNEEVKLDDDAVEKLSPEERVKYGLMGSALDIKAMQEKYHIELSPDFLRDVTLMKMSGEEVGAYIKEFADNGITKMQDMTDYLRENETESSKKDISSSMMDTLRNLYPELSDSQLESKIMDMERELKYSDI